MPRIDISNSGEVSLPSEDQAVAIALKPKTAALVYDRIWSPFAKSRLGLWLEVPKVIRCYGGTKEESTASAAIGLIQQEFSLEEELKRGMGAKYGGTRGSLERIMELFSKVAFREISESFSSRYGVFMVPVYDSRERRDKEYHEGNREVIIATLVNLQIVDEDQLMWDQVLEFRADPGACRRYRRFMHWLDREMVGRSQAFIEDEIALKLEDYESALKKHGVKTVLGTVEEVLDGKYVMSAAATTTSLTLAGHPTLGILAGAGLIVGKVVVKLGQTFLDLRDVEQGLNSEVSWVYEVKQLGE